MNACREFHAALPALVEGELAIERTLALEEHARGCARCARLLARERALEDALRALPAPPIERLDLERNVRAVLERLDQGASRPAPARPSRAWKRIAALAAALLAGFFVWRLVRTRDAAPLPIVVEVSGASEDSGAREDGAARLDRERLERAREDVCAALRECAPGFDPDAGDALAFVRAVDERTAELERSGWPLTPLVQRAAADPDARLAARALRWLGAHGERAAAGQLRSALARSELAPSAIAALLDLGSDALPELRGTLDSPAQRELVLARLAARPNPAAVAWLEELRERQERARTASTADKQRVVDTLVLCGPASVPALLRLASHRTLDGDELLASLERIRGADAALGSLLRDGNALRDGNLLRDGNQLRDGRAASLDPELVLAAVARVGTSAGWDWVERMAREGDHRDAALFALARGGAPGLAALLRLRAASGADGEELQRALDTLWNEQPGAAAELASELARTGARSELAQLYEVASADPGPRCVPALVEIAGSTLLPEIDRRWSLLLVAEQGSAADVPALLALFPRLRERTLQAVCLLALHTLGGAEAVERALEKRSASVRRRVLAVLADPANANRGLSTLARLVRAIEASLPAPQS